MEKKELLRRIAPCSALCFSCTNCKDGVFSEFSPVFDRFGEIFNQAFSGIPDTRGKKITSFFQDFSDSFQNPCGGQCHGCREDLSLKQGCAENCGIPSCAAQRGVDFCADCSDFPCKMLNEPMIKGGRRIQKIGAAQYWEETKGFVYSSHSQKKPK